MYCLRSDEYEFLGLDLQLLIFSQVYVSSVRLVFGE
jgi:hypothetical protein